MRKSATERSTTAVKGRVRGTATTSVATTAATASRAGNCRRY